MHSERPRDSVEQFQPECRVVRGRHGCIMISSDRWSRPCPLIFAHFMFLCLSRLFSQEAIMRGLPSTASPPRETYFPFSSVGDPRIAIQIFRNQKLLICFSLHPLDAVSDHHRPEFRFGIFEVSVSRLVRSDNLRSIFWNRNFENRKKIILFYFIILILMNGIMTIGNISDDFEIVPKLRFLRTPL